MTLKLIVLEASEPSDYPQFQAAMDKLSSNGQATVVKSEAAPNLVIPPVPPVAPPAEQGNPLAELVAQVERVSGQQQGNPMAPVAAFALPTAAAAPVAGKRGGKRTDGLGMRGHAQDCDCPADTGIRKALAKAFNVQAIDAVPAEGTPEAAQWAAALSASQPAAPVAAAPMAVPTPAPAAPAVPDLSAQLAAMGQQQQVPAAPVAEPAAPSLPQYISQYPSLVYQVCTQWAAAKAVKFTVPKQQAIMDFLNGKRTLDSLADIKHKEGTLRDVFAGLIRQALTAQ